MAASRPDRGDPAPPGLPHDPEVDRWLVGRVAVGDAGAYEELLRRHRDRVYRIALRVLGNAADAEDVTQEVALQLWTGVAGFAGRSTFTTWLYRVVIHRCLNLRRRLRPSDDLADHDPASTALDPQRRVIDGEELRAGLEALAAMPDDLRIPLVLVQLEGLSYAEAATVLRVPESTVRSRLARARASLVRQTRKWS